MTDTAASGWYYVANGERVGPVSLDEIRALVVEGALADDALVWTPGMGDWATVNQIPVLAASWKLQAADREAPEPEATPEIAASPPPAADAPHPWHRWLARLVDGAVLGFMVGLLAMPLLMLVMGSAEPPLTGSPMRVWAMSLVLTGLQVPLEAFFLSRRGTTPGKALLGIHVRTAEGGIPSFRVAMERAVRSWIMGSGLGVPPLTLAAWIFGYFHLLRTGSTPWDQALDLRVEQTKLSPARGFAIGAVVVVIILLAVLNMPGIKPVG
ncbi:MAG TPA: RDD family protein [Longimicrobium sp.]|nr:RDD family protein [Longimicrobium sp.]